MPASLSEIDRQMSDDDESDLTDEEVDQLAGDTSDSDEPDSDMDEMDRVSRYLSSDDTPSVASDRSLGSCACCELPLGGNTEVQSRAFRCGDCAALQCERCCYDIHVCVPEHPLREWDARLDEWFRTDIKESALSATHATLCGNCERVLASAGTTIRAGSLLCEECGLGVVCQRCCFDLHQKEPLHRVKAWSGRTWDPTTLREHGFVYNMGHHGNPCPHPDPDISSLIVREQRGYGEVQLVSDKEEWLVPRNVGAPGCLLHLESR
ncbi:hypothetical protein B0H11DRAFT_1918682 [Mycena galericulata]|nr:hypothetical protein B0H11DRAFT_1918682 [Mycena galericulata]